MVSESIKRLFGSNEERRSSRFSGLGIKEIEKVGTPEDPLHGYEKALERNFAVVKAERREEVDRTVVLYEQSVEEDFVESHPYARLAGLYERRRNCGEALRVSEAHRRLPEIEARVARHRKMLEGD